MDALVARAPQRVTLTELLGFGERIGLHGLALLGAVFIGIYGRTVCPFVSGLSLGEFGTNLLLVFGLQLLTRELLFMFVPTPGEHRSLPRHGYYLSVVSWLLAGVYAMGLHGLRYEDFPIGSHLKLMSGYWVVGACLLAQWEYVSLERLARLRALRYANAERYLERITVRVMEGFVLFTLAPALAMALTLARQQYEGFVDGEVVLEVAFLSGFCVLVALATAIRFGNTLREDSRAIVTGTQRVRDGDRDVVLDTSRLDEFGEVAAGINSMCRELEQQNRRLEKQLVDLDALNDVSHAMSSLHTDRILNLIVENSKVVTRAEASSLLLVDADAGELYFHVLQGDAADDLREVRVPIGTGIVGTVAATGKPLLIPDAYADPRFDRSFDDRTGFRTRTLLTVPMVSQDEVLGVIQVINRADGAEFNADDLHLLQSFASHAAISLRNARMFEQTQQLANDLREALENERRLTIEKEKMGAYIPRQVVDEISRNREQKLALGGKTVVASVLFSDIKGFTALSEHLDPQEIVAFLNVYMTAMTDIIDEGGIVDKFMGDGIMAIFTDVSGSNDNNEAHAVRAARAGMRMQQALAELRARDQALAHLQMRVGINTGEMVAGNIGSQTRMEYTVIGDNVNVASRVEGAAEPGTVLVTDSTWAMLGGGFEGVQKAPISVKNRSEPVRTWQLA